MNKAQDARAREVLPFIPVAALQLAVARKDGAPAALEKMTGTELRKYVLRSGALKSDEIIELFEQWRYGKVPLSLAIFEKRPRKPGVGFRSEVEKSLEAMLDEREASAAERELAIRIIGEDSFDDGHIIELVFRYGHLHAYLDLEEREQEVAESRWGFAWLAPRDQFLALTGEEGIVDRMMTAIAAAIGARPKRVALDKATLDRHFKLESISSIAHLDISTGTRHRVSREGLHGDPRAYEEVTQRDKASQRLGALYGESIAGLGSVNVGVNADRGRIQMARQLPASALRGWAAPKLAALTRSLLELRENEPVAFFQGLRDREIDGVPRLHQDAVGALALAIATCRSKTVDRVRLDRTAQTLAAHLPAKAGRLAGRLDCAACGEIVLAQCGACLSSRLVVAGDQVACADCGGKAFSCHQGHPMGAVALLESLTYEPDETLFNWLSRALVMMNSPVFNSTAEQFWVRGSDLLFQNKGLVPSGDYTVLMVDIEGSTNLGKNKKTYAQFTTYLSNSLMAVTRTRAGHFGQDTGDGGFAFFTKPSEAVAAARALQARLEDNEHNPLGAKIRVGLATGGVLSEGGRYTGTAINLSERLQKEAVSGSRIAACAKTVLGAREVGAKSAGKLSRLKGFEDSTEEYFLLSL